MKKIRAKRHQIYDFIKDKGVELSGYEIGKLKKLINEYSHLNHQDLKFSLEKNVNRNKQLREQIRRKDEELSNLKKSIDSPISIRVYQQDWIPGFAAFYNNGQIKKNAKAHVVLNLGSCLVAVANKDIDKKELPYLVAETIMHEVIHVLEAWAEVEFNEDKVHALTEKYNKKHKGY